MKEAPAYTEENAANAQRNWRILCPIFAERHCRVPGVRCIVRAGGGTCRKHSHRFATFSVCPKHHPQQGRYLESRSERVEKCTAEAAKFEGRMNRTYEELLRTNPKRYREPLEDHMEIFREWKAAWAVVGPREIKELPNKYGLRSDDRQRSQFEKKRFPHAHVQSRTHPRYISTK